MDDPYRELSKNEREESDRLAEDAAERGAHALSASTISAARLAIEASTNVDDERMALMSLRTDPRFQRPLASDLAKERQRTESVIIEAMRIGYLTDIHGRSAAIESQSTGLRFAISVSGNDLIALHEWPIQGHTPREIADYLLTTVRYAIDAVMSSPLSAVQRAAGLPGALMAVAQAHGTRVGNAVSEAYYAAVRKSTSDLRKARLVA